MENQDFGELTLHNNTLNFILILYYEIFRKFFKLYYSVIFFLPTDLYTTTTLQRTIFLNVIRKDLCMYYISTVNANPFIPLVTPPGMYLISYRHTSTSYFYLPGGLGIYIRKESGRLLQQTWAMVHKPDKV